MRTVPTLKSCRDYLFEHRRQAVIVASLLYLLGGIVFGLIFLEKTSNLASSPSNSPTPDGNSSHTLDEILTTTFSAVDQKTREDVAVQKEKRVNIVLLGIDQRDDERARGDPSRTDSILIVTLDLTNKTAGLLSVPRDLYVTIPDIRIPGYGSGPQIDRINTAHFWGDWLKYPGGGPELLKKTLAHNFGIPVDHYVRIDFRGFEKAIDALGGVTVNVERPILDEEYPTEDYEVMTVYFAAGQQRLNGKRALQYARTRHADNDFGRSKRQQQVLIALAQQALRIDALPKLPALVSSLGSSLKTDIPVADMLRYGAVAKEIEPSEVVIRQIDPTMVSQVITSGGADVLMPRKERIDLALHEIFYGVQVRREDAKIVVLSGVNKANAAGRLAKSLQNHGYNVVKVDDADNKDYLYSKMTYQSIKPYTVMTLATRLKTQAATLSISRNMPGTGESANPRPSDIDITIIVGQDMVDNIID